MSVKSPEEMTIGELRLAIWEVDRQKSWLDSRRRDLDRVLKKAESFEKGGKGPVSC